MLKVAAGYARCQGYADCIMADPDVSGFDDEQGVVVLGEAVEDRERGRVAESVRSWPVSALSEQLAD